MWRFLDANTPYHAMTLTSDPLTLESLWWSVSGHVFIVCGKFDRNRTIAGWVIHNLAKFCPCYVTLWPWPFTSWPWTFVVLRASHVQTLYKIWAKSNNPRQSYWRYRTFSLSTFRGWITFSGRFSGVRGPNFSKLGQNTGNHGRVCFRVEISCCIFKRRCLKVERRWKWRQISHFWPL